METTRASSNIRFSRILLSPRRMREILWGYVFIAPTVIGLTVFLIGPIFYSLYMSLFKWDNLTVPIYIGLANFQRLFSDATIARELWQTLLFTFIIIPLSILVALLLANTLSKGLPGTGFFRSAFFTPYITLPVAAAMVWQAMFNSKFGMVNNAIALLGVTGPAWLTDPPWVRVVLILMGVWQRMGYMAIILLAGIKNVPHTYMEAAQLDGARPQQTFFSITLPLITPQIFFVLCTGIIGGFQIFDVVYVFGRGNAVVTDAIRTLVFGIYERGFTYMEMGYASAEALALFLMIMVITVAQFMVQRLWVNYDT